jgi:hypothetical protein
MDVTMVRIYNRIDCCADKFNNFEIRVGEQGESTWVGDGYSGVWTRTFGSNPACATGQPWFSDKKDFACVLRGRYVSVQQFNNVYMHLREIEVFGPEPVRYVLQECNASRDVICEECKTCGQGFFANNTCGPNYSNDRLDTECAVCPAGSYCPTGLGPHIPCPNNGQSLPGSISDDACDCDPGYFRDVDGCKQCFLDTYCPGEQVQHAISCPPMSRTITRGSTMRMDCSGPQGEAAHPPPLRSCSCTCVHAQICSVRLAQSVASVAAKETYGTAKETTTATDQCHARMYPQRAQSNTTRPRETRHSPVGHLKGSLALFFLWLRSSCSSPCSASGAPLSASSSEL